MCVIGGMHTVYSPSCQKKYSPEPAQDRESPLDCELEGVSSADDSVSIEQSSSADCGKLVEVPKGRQASVKTERWENSKLLNYLCIS